MSQFETKPLEEREERLRFETLLIEISTYFINLPADQIDHAIEDAQRKVCEFFGLDRSSILQRSMQQSDVYVCTHIYQPADVKPIMKSTNTSFSLQGKWTMQGSDGTPVYMQIKANTSFPWLFGQVFQYGKTVIVSGIEDLPPEASYDVDKLNYFGTKSTVIIPLKIGGVVIGCITFATVRKARKWPQVIVKQFNLIAQIFANALSRKSSELQLRNSEARLSLAAASADAGLWVLEMDTGKIWCTEKVRQLFGFAQEEEITIEDFLEKVHPEDRERLRLDVKSGNDLNIEYRIMLSDNSIHWIVSRGRLQSTAPGEPPSLMGVSIDVSARKDSERLLQNAYEEIKELKDRLEAENIYLRKEVYAGDTFKNIIGQSEPLKQVLRKVEQVASTDATVLLSGETGTGKELIAQAIHDLSKRKDRILVKVNCAALPAPLIESELFGREKGAYTGALARQIGRFELADHSTLLLDEITELPLELQAKLLRVLQSGEFERLGSPKTIHADVRVIAATNRDMALAVKNGSFREDLYYRLKVFPIEVPPLRERPEDIPLLVQAFVNEFSGKMGKKIQTVPKKIMQTLQRYHWPGNIRELRNVIEQAVIVSSGNVLQVHLPQALVNARLKNQTLEEAEYQHIMGALNKTCWRIKGPNGAAELLGLKPSTLFSRMKKLGIRNHRVSDDISP